MTTSWTAEQRRSMHRAGIPANVMDRLLSCFEDSAEDSKLDHMVSVEDYAENRILTTANFEAALIAALAAANAVVGSGDTPVGMTILIPAGEWPCTQTIQIKGRGYAIAPLLVGAGSGATRLTWADMPVGGTYMNQGVCVALDGYASESVGFHRGGLVGLSIQATGANAYGATGIYFEGLLNTRISDVVVRGFQSVSTKSGQTGVVASCAVADTTYGTQVWSGLTGMTQDSVGRVLTTTGATTGANNGTFLITHYVSATSVKVYNPSGTSDASNTALTWTEKFNGTGIRSRGDYTNSRGESTFNSQQPVFTGVESSINRIGWWLESCYPLTLTACRSNQCATHDVVLGHNTRLTWTGDLMQSNHGGSTIFELPYTAGGRSCTFEGIYHEGAVASILKTFPPASGANDYVLRRVDQSNATTYLDLNGTHSVHVSNPGNPQGEPTVWLKARSCGTIVLEGAVFSPFITSAYGTTYARDTTKYDIDQFSYEGLTINSRRGVYSPQVVPQKTLNRILIERDIAAEIWDLRVTSKCTVNAGNLEAVTGLINGLVAGPVNAGVYPTYQASNAAIGSRPSFTTTAAAAGAGGMLKATITAGLMPIGSSPGVLFVFRLASATPDNTIYRYVGFTGADTRRREFHLGDSTTNGYFALDTYGSNFLVQAACETLPQVALHAAVCREGSTPTRIYHASTGITIGAQVNNYEATAAGGTVYMGGDTQASGVLEIAYVAVLKRYLGMQEHHAILDAAAAEFGPIARY
jgi:hypothetical protein